MSAGVQAVPKVAGVSFTRQSYYPVNDLFCFPDNVICHGLCLTYTTIKK